MNIKWVKYLNIHLLWFTKTYTATYVEVVPFKIKKWEQWAAV